MFECDKCHKEFDSELGLKTHFGQMHGHTRECQQCGKEFSKPPSRDHKFCSKECDYEYKRENGVNQGPDNGNWTGGKKEIQCTNCGDEFMRHVNNIKDENFCSRSCAQSGEYANNWKEYDKVKCEVCGVVFEKVPSARPRKFCSRQCLGKHLKKARRGSGNPRWVEKSDKEKEAAKYAHGWKEKRLEAIERDNEECVNCGISREEHKKKYGRDLSVDHIKPRRYFIKDGEFDYENADKLENLRTVCNACHSRLENSKKFSGVFS